MCDRMGSWSRVLSGSYPVLGGWVEPVGGPRRARCESEQGLRGPEPSVIVRHTILIAAAVLGLVCWGVQAGQATATIGISARVDPFAEWAVSEAPTSLTTITEGQSLHIAKTLTLFANTDVSLTLAPHVNGGALTADDGEALQTVGSLTGDVASADVGNVYRIRHVPGRGAYEVVLDVRATLPAGMAIHSATSTTSVQHAGQNHQQADATFEVNASAQDSPALKTYRCGYSITVSW